MIGVSPENLELNIAQNGAGRQNLFLKNFDQSESTIFVSAEEHGDYLEIDPAEFVLSASGERAVSITAKQGKNFSTNLEVVSSDNPEVAAGIKIPVTVSGNSFLAQYQFGFLILGALLVTILAYAITRRKHEKKRTAAVGIGSLRVP